MNDTIVLGVDVGGSHISAALVDLDTCAVLAGSYVRREINTQGTVADIIGNWSEVIEAAKEAHPGYSGKIGIAMPGPFEYSRGVSRIKGQNKYDVLYGLNVRELLGISIAVAAANIRFLNDAECFLLGEAFCGAAQAHEQVLGLTLGTGLGSARCAYGKVEDADLWRSPFRGGIAEDYLSTRWFLKRYRDLAGKALEGVKELTALAPEDQHVQLVFDEFGANLASFIQNCLAEKPAEVVVLGGNIANAYPLFSSSLAMHLASLSVSVPVRVAALGEEAALIGAASSWRQRVQERVAAE